MSLVLKICLASVLHFIGDFICQSDYIALNKSKDNKVLGLHCLIYTAFFTCFGPVFAMWVFVTHFITDYFTSRLNSYLYPRNRHWFFVGIGADQMIHQLTLISLLCNLK